MNNNEQLVQYLVQKGSILTENIKEAFLNINRADFVSEEEKNLAYADIAVSIGYGQTISQPSTVAFMLEKLRPKKGDTILDIGCGSGYTTALLSYIVGSDGLVIGLERIPELLETARNNLEKYKDLNFELKQAEKDYFGIKGEKFNKILVSAAAESLPSELIEQLKNNSRMVIPINNSILLVKKDENGIVETKDFYGFTFVPLVK